MARQSTPTTHLKPTPRWGSSPTPTSAVIATETTATTTATTTTTTAANVSSIGATGFVAAATVDFCSNDGMATQTTPTTNLEPTPDGETARLRRPRLWQQQKQQHQPKLT